MFISTDADEIRRLVAAGFCPVECAIGSESIMDSLSMDHHGAESHREGVAIRAYRDHFGFRKDDPRFVVAGTADADATFAVAALAGLLPHPSRAPEFADAPPALREAMTRDLAALAATVNLLDVNPIGVDVTEVPFGDVVQSWKALTHGTSNTTLGLYTGVGLWVNFAKANPALAVFFAAAKENEARRIATAREDLVRADRLSPEVLCIAESSGWGFDVWYGRRLEAGSADDPIGWKAPVVIARSARSRGVTIGCPNQEVAEALFGPGGLKNVFAKLEPQGWGGREASGGSPRGQKLTREQALEAARIIAAAILR